MTHSRRYEEIRLTMKPEQTYTIDDAIEKLKASATAGFDETAEAVFKLGIKPSQVSVRGTCSLPHGTGKTLCILVFAKGEGLTEAREAGADYVGGEDLAGKIRDGWLEFDKIVASPEMMSVVGKLGKILGPRGLMPSPKTGTVTTSVGETVEELKRGMVEFRNDRHGAAHCIFGKVSFDASALKENLIALIESVAEQKPEEGLKDRYMKKTVIASTMGPGIVIDPEEIAMVTERTD